MDTPNSIDNLNEFMNLSLQYYEKMDYNNALKYAALASVSTDYPRADVCCQMGDIYLEKGNLDWAKFWFERAIGNIYVDHNGDKLDDAFYTWVPLLKLSYILYKLGDVQGAFDYNESVLLIQPDNEDAISNREFLSNILERKEE